MNQTPPNDAAGEQSQEKQINPLTVVHDQIVSERMTKELKAALPEHISVEKFQRVVVTAINKNPALVNAVRLSLFTACVECAQDGLLPNGKEAALVIYNTKNKQTDQWENKVQYMPMITGIYKKAHNSGEVVFLDAHAVHKNDEFNYELGLNINLVHRPALDDRGEMIAAYAVARLADGTEYAEVMSTKDIEYVRDDASKTAQKGPWKTYYGEMARKTVVRRLSKRLPLSSDLERVINRIDAMHALEGHQDDTETPARPDPSKYSKDLYCLIDEYGENVGAFSQHEFVEQCTSKIEGFENQTLLEAFWDFNIETIEGFGPRSNDRKDISFAYNTARGNFDKSPDETAPEESKKQYSMEEWEAAWDAIEADVNNAPDIESLNDLLKEKETVFTDMLEQEPMLHGTLMNRVNEREDELTPVDDQEKSNE